MFSAALSGYCRDFPGPDQTRTALASRLGMDDKKRIAAAIKDYLARERISREQFAFKTKLGKSTVDKLLIGLFSDRTLSIVEGHTKLSLRSASTRNHHELPKGAFLAVGHCESTLHSKPSIAV